MLQVLTTLSRQTKLLSIKPIVLVATSLYCLNKNQRLANKSVQVKSHDRKFNVSYLPVPFENTI